MWAALSDTRPPSRILTRIAPGVDHRVELLQRATPPLQDGVGDGVGDVVDRPRAQLYPQGGVQVVADLAHRHPAGVQADDHAVQPVHAPLALAHQAGRERAGAVAGDLDLKRAHLGVPSSWLTSRFARCPARSLVVAQVVGQLGLQAPLQGLLEQRRQKPVGAGQRDLASIDLLEQAVQATGGNQLLHRPTTRATRSGLLIGHGHQCQSFQEGLHKPLNKPVPGDRLPVPARGPPGHLFPGP